MYLPLYQGIYPCIRVSMYLPFYHAGYLFIYPCIRVQQDMYLSLYQGTTHVYTLVIGYLSLYQGITGHVSTLVK